MSDINSEIRNKCKSFIQRVNESKKKFDKLLNSNVKSYGQRLIIGETTDKFFIAQSISKEESEDLLHHIKDKEWLKQTLLNRYDISSKYADSFGHISELQDSIYINMKTSIRSIYGDKTLIFICYSDIKIEDNSIKFGDNLYHLDKQSSLKCLLSNLASDYLILYYINKDDKDKHFRYDCRKRYYQH